MSRSDHVAEMVLIAEGEDKENGEKAGLTA